MNYAGFTRPVWAWLRGDDLPTDPATSFIGLPVGVPQLPGESIVRTMRAFRAGIPWTASLHSWAILDSHDSPASASSQAHVTASSSASASR